MNTLKAIRTRRTIRDFSKREISSDKIKEIIAAGLQAPSNDHMRSWEFIVINDIQTREKLVSVINAPVDRKSTEALLQEWGLRNPLQKEMYLDGIPKQHSMLITCSVLIIPCFKNNGNLLKPENLSSLNSFASIWCCIENMLIAASARKIYGVTRIPFENERRVIREELGIPEEYEYPCYLALGYSGTDKKIKQIDLHIDDKIHRDRW